MIGESKRTKSRDTAEYLTITISVTTSGRAKNVRGSSKSSFPNVTGPDPPERVVVFLHGLMRTHRSYHTLGDRLLNQNFATPIYFGYASTRADVKSHAEALRQLVEGMPGNPKIDFVAHSLGNIVARHAIADWQHDGDPKQVLPRMGRFVMQGPPNQGAMIAKRLKIAGPIRNRYR